MQSRQPWTHFMSTKSTCTKCINHDCIWSVGGIFSKWSQSKKVTEHLTCSKMCRMLGWLVWCICYSCHFCWLHCNEASQLVNVSISYTEHIFLLRIWNTGSCISILPRNVSFIYVPLTTGRSGVKAWEITNVTHKYLKVNCKHTFHWPSNTVKIWPHHTAVCIRMHNFLNEYALFCLPLHRSRPHFSARLLLKAWTHW